MAASLGKIPTTLVRRLTSAGGYSFLNGGGDADTLIAGPANAFAGEVDDLLDFGEFGGDLDRFVTDQGNPYDSFLAGGSGGDALFGGAGRDALFYESIGDAGATGDVVAGFTSGSDKFVFDSGDFGDAIGEGDTVNFVGSDGFDAGIGTAFGFAAEAGGEGGALYYDSDTTEDGYTIIANLDSGTVTEGDIVVA